jgi:hypothetical protein
MAIQTQSADGVIHQFPDGTDPAVIDKAMKAYAQQKAQSNSLAGQVTGFMANVNRGLGIGDELAAGAKTVGNLFAGKLSTGPQVVNGQIQANGQGFDQALVSDFKANLAHQRGLEANYQQDHPHMAALGRGTGMAATVAVPAGNTANVFAQGSRIGNAVRGATQAGLTAAGYAAADAGSPGERLQAAADAANPVKNPFTFALGAAGGALATPSAPKAQPLSRDELAATKDRAYQAVDQSGVTYTPEAFRTLTQDMANGMDAQGFHAGLHPKSAAMMERIGQSDRGIPGGYSPTLTQLDQLRQQIGRDVASANDAGDARMGQIMRGQIDNFINGAKPEDLAAAGIDPAEAADLINTARGLNTRLAKVDAINEATGLADRRAARTGSGGNIDNVIRQNMDKLLESVPNWTPEERQALDNIVMGGRGQNLLRLLGKLSPSGNGLHLLLNLGATGAGGAVGGPGGAAAGAAPAVVGILSKLAADGITRGKVARLVAELSTVNPAATVAASPLTGQAAARLSRAAGVGGAAAVAQRAPNPFAQPAPATSN